MTTSKILVVEDERAMRELYVTILRDAGYEVDEAGDGEEAYNKIINGDYALILLDIVLPKLDGLEVLERIKGTASEAIIRTVILITNLGEELIIARALKLGVRGYLIKSDYTPDKLLQEVRHFLKKTPKTV